MNKLHTELVERLKPILNDKDLQKTILVLLEWERQDRADIQAADVFCGVTLTFAVLYSFWFMHLGLGWLRLAVQAILGVSI